MHFHSFDSNKTMVSDLYGMKKLGTQVKLLRRGASVPVVADVLGVVRQQLVIAKASHEVVLGASKLSFNEFFECCDRLNMVNERVEVRGDDNFRSDSCFLKVRPVARKSMVWPTLHTHQR